MDRLAERSSFGGYDLEPAVATSVSVVMPCLNEASSVGGCVEEALAALKTAGYDGEVVVVDNGSTDGSDDVARAAGARVIYESRRGYGAALLAGFRAANGDVIVMADADATYPLDRIGDLVAPVASGDADMVFGSRLNSATHRTMPMLHRFVGTPALTFLAARACGRRVVGDSQSGFRAFRRDTLAQLKLRSTGMELASEMLIRAARAGLTIEEIDTGYRPRVGESKLSTFSDGFRHLYLILLLAPDLMLIGPGATAFVIGIVCTVLSIVRPNGVELGSLQWQPVFFSTIFVVLGAQALLAGMVLAYQSSITRSSMRRRLTFVGSSRFPNWCFGTGFIMTATGLAIDIALLVTWVNNPQPPHTFGVASLAQSLIILGGTLSTFGILQRFERARVARKLVPVDVSPQSREMERAAVR